MNWADALSGVKAAYRCGVCIHRHEPCERCKISTALASECLTQERYDALIARRNELDRQTISSSEIV